MAYLPYIFGFGFLMFGLFLFLYSFRIYKPKHKTEKQKQAYKKALSKYGSLMKVCSIILILSGVYEIAKPHSNRYQINNRTQKAEWTSQDRAILIKNCLRDSGPMSTNYPQITEEYCACSMDKIMSAMTRDEYEESLSKPQTEQLKQVLPIFQECLTLYQKQIDSLEKPSSENFF